MTDPETEEHERWEALMDSAVAKVLVDSFELRREIDDLTLFDAMTSALAVWFLLVTKPTNPLGLNTKMLRDEPGVRQLLHERLDALIEGHLAKWQASGA